MNQPLVALAGASGDLGGRIARELGARGASVRALVRDETSTEARGRLESAGASPEPVDFADAGSVARACRGATCVVSAVSGTREVIVDLQNVLLEGAVRAGVPRLVSSDYSADFTHTTPGHNRNFDLRREFMARADRSPIRTTSIFVGAFLDMLGAEMPIIWPRLKRVVHVGDAGQPIDFTSRADTAAFTAAAALDEATPRILRVAGDTVSAHDIAAVLTELSGNQFRTARLGSPDALGRLAGLVRRVSPQRQAVFPAWQGMQYMRDQFSGAARLRTLDNDRYPDLAWTRVRDHLAGADSRWRGPVGPTRTASHA